MVLLSDFIEAFIKAPEEYACEAAPLQVAIAEEGFELIVADFFYDMAADFLFPQTFYFKSSPFLPVRYIMIDNRLRYLNVVYSDKWVYRSSMVDGIYFPNKPTCFSNKPYFNNLCMTPDEIKKYKTFYAGDYTFKSETGVNICWISY